MDYTDFDGYAGALERLAIEPTEVVLWFHYGEKKLVWQRGSEGVEFCSGGSARPPSCRRDSLGTPWGLHRVCARYGDGVSPGTVFISRRSTGRHYREHEEEAADRMSLVTTRILWLDGMEEGINRGGEVDTRGRYIYIHGTNRSEALPANISAGCILLDDADLIRVFDHTPVGSHVYIVVN